MNEHRDEHSRTLRWILSLPGVPRPLIAALFALCWFYLWLGSYLESQAMPEQIWWLNVWNGSFGGNGFGAFGATVLALTLTAEVIFMVFSLGAYLRQKERAKLELAEAKERVIAETQEKVAAEVKEAVAERASKERDKEWMEWLEAVRPDLDAGRPPSLPPPTDRNGTGA